MSDEPHADHARRRVVLQRLIACCISLAIGLVVAIIVLRDRFDDEPIYVQEPGHEVTGHRYVHDEVIGWRNIPNWKATTFGRPLTNNSKGLRDREYPYEKPTGTSRILVLGDSFAWGYGVGDQEIFTDVLEENLQGSSTTREVQNASVSGWGTDQEYLFLDREGFKYSPDIVVLALFTLNDPANSSTSFQYGLHKPVFLNTDLELANVPVPVPSEAPSGLESEADGIELTLAIIRRMAEECTANRCGLVVMKFGTFLNPADPGPQPLDDELALMEEIHFMDLDAVFAEEGYPVSEIVREEDVHWNTFGHVEVAKALQEFLEGEGLLLGGE